MPPTLKSFCSRKPVLYIIAFGGVDTGRKSAVEEESAMINDVSVFNPVKMAKPNGINTVLVAV